VKRALLSVAIGILLALALATGAGMKTSTGQALAALAVSSNNGRTADLHFRKAAPQRRGPQLHLRRLAALRRHDHELHLRHLRRLAALRRHDHELRLRHLRRLRELRRHDHELHLQYLRRLRALHIALARRARVRGGIAVRAAISQLGVPYVWGGATPGVGFDCSGLTMWAWARAGVRLSHGATDQYYETRHVSLWHLLPGDLIFYGAAGYLHHVVMYVGHGDVVQAEQTGTNVMITPIPPGPFAASQP
jgi:NlpC/P60 family